MCECLTSSATDTGGTDGTGGDRGGTVFGLIGTLCSGVQGDFAVARGQNQRANNVMMQVNTFFDLEQRNLQQQEQNHLNLTLCCKNVYLPDINEVVGGWWM